MISLITNSPPAILPEGVRISTIEECVDFCKCHTVLSVDTETAGMDYFDKKMLMCQIGNAEHQYVIDVRDTSILKLKPILEDLNTLKIFHNVKFDYHFFRELGIMLWNVYDTFLAEQVLYNGYKNKGYGLKDLAYRYLDVAMDKEERNKFINISSVPFTERQIRYGAKDVELLESIMRKQLTKAKEDELENVIELENKAVLALADIEHNGMYLNKERWLNEAKGSMDKLRDYRKKLDSMIFENPLFEKIIPKYIQSDIFTPIEEVRKVNINWDSPSQVLKIVRVLLPGIADTNAFTLEKHTNIPLIKELLTYREIYKEVSTYGPGFVENIHHKTGRIHTNIWQVLVTGRISSSNPNMQNIPADNKFRNCFEPGIKDWVFVSGDYSSQELCIIAVKSNDRTWMEALHNGWDFKQYFCYN